MAIMSLAGGLIAECPDGLQIHEAGVAPGGLGAVPSGAAVGTDDVLWSSVAANADFTVVSDFVLTGEPGPAGLGAAESAAPRDFVLQLPLEEGESAVMLSERDGVLRWEYPDSIEEAAGGGLGAAAALRRLATWRNPARPSRSVAAAPQGLGFSADFLLAPVKKLVLRFAARKAAGALSNFLEKETREGPILFSKGPDGRVDWRPVSSFPGVFQGPGPHNLLLFVHGTFSSVDGSFGGLLTTSEGKSFLAQALDRYQAVVGFDHKTLTKNVGQNAVELLAALEKLGAGEVNFDAVAFSRGGLVLRHLTEILLPAQPQPRFHLKKAVFVGCTNAGTLLADPQYWKDLLDLYTNLVSGAGRLMSKLGGPSTQLAGRIVTGALRGAFSFVRYLAEAATGEEVPGLASMNPGGADVQRINAVQPGQNASGAAFYVIDSNFDHKLLGPGPLENAGLGQRLFLEFADDLVDKLFKKAPNDLVVDRASMSKIDPGAPSAIQDQDGFEPGEGVYHTVYFHQSKVAAKLTAWLHLDS